MAKCPVYLHSNSILCPLCNNTDKVPTELAVEYVLLGIDDIDTWRLIVWREQVKQLLERHKYNVPA